MKIKCTQCNPSNATPPIHQTSYLNGQIQLQHQPCEAARVVHACGGAVGLEGGDGQRQVIEVECPHERGLRPGLENLESARRVGRLEEEGQINATRKAQDNTEMLSAPITKTHLDTRHGFDNLQTTSMKDAHESKCHQARVCLHVKNCVVPLARTA